MSENEQPEEVNRWGNVKLTPETLTTYPVLLCPLTANVCPGVERCAPAVLAANAQNALLSADQAPHGPECPIVSVVASTGILAASVWPLLYGKDEREESEDETPQDEQATPEAIIQKLIDQPV